MLRPAAPCQARPRHNEGFFWVLNARASGIANSRRRARPFHPSSSGPFRCMRSSLKSLCWLLLVVTVSFCKMASITLMDALPFLEVHLAHLAFSKEEHRNHEHTGATNRWLVL